MEAGCLGKLVIRRLEISAPPPTSGEGRRAGGCVQSPMDNDLIIHDCVMKSP